MRSVDLIGCGALNLDLIYRLPEDSTLWKKLPPPGSEFGITAEERAPIDAALAEAEVEPTWAGGANADSGNRQREGPKHSQAQFRLPVS